MRYHATDIEVQLGDRVIYRHLLWRRSTGIVAFLPDKVSQVEVARFYDTPDWVVNLESGKSVFMAYGPGIDTAHRRVAFVERGDWKPRIATEGAMRLARADDSGTPGSMDVEESYGRMPPSRVAVNPDKAEAWAGRLFLGAIIALLAFLYLSNE